MALLRQLNRLRLTISFPRVDLLASLLYGLQDGLIVDRWLGEDGRRLGVKRDIVRFNAYTLT